MSYIGNTTVNQNYVPAVDYFNGDGSTVAFTLSRPVASVAAVQAVISNVPQNPGSAFTVSGSTITFTSAPPSGTNNVYVYYTSPNTQVVQPGQGTVGATQVDGNYALWNKSGSDINYTAGNVGIGTSSPVSKLNVNGGTVTLAETTTGVYNIDFQSRTASTNARIQYDQVTNSTGQLLFYTNGGSLTERMRIDSSGNVGIGTSSPSVGLQVQGSGSESKRTIRAAYDGTYYLDIAQLGAGGVAYRAFGGPQHIWEAAGVERMRIDSSGNLLVGKASPDFGTAGSIFQPSGECDFTKDSNPAMYVNRLTNDGYLMLFYGQSVNRGGIAVSGSTIQYNSFSDYRLKENIQPMQNALATVAQLNPVTYTWKADGSDGQGFIAHELQAVVPDAVNGEKDAVDDEGKPLYQGIDTSFLVATLTKAIQELNAKVEAQAAEIAALKGIK